MANYNQGSTLICSIVVRDSAGDLKNPGTSMQININRLSPSFAAVVALTGMTNDSTGMYHYDFDTSSAQVGSYEVYYTATDDSRITKARDTFNLEQ